MSDARARRTALVIVALAAWAAPLPAQDGPWVPLGSRLDRATRWALDAGVIGGLNPHVRPFRRAAVAQALAASDTSQLTAAARRAWLLLEGELARTADTFQLSAEVALQAYRHGSRDSFRPAGRRYVRPAGGIWASAASGALVAVVNPAFESRLWDDPEYSGEKNTEVAGRVQSAYLAGSWRAGDLLFGRMARQWGPDLFDGLLVSPAPYSGDALHGAVRLGRFELTALAQRLDADSLLSGTTATPYNRYLFAHRLDIRLGRGAWLGLVEAGVYGGRGAGWDPAMHSPLNIAIVSEINEDIDANIMMGADLVVPLGRLGRLEMSAMLDDIQTDDSVLRDQRPTSYAATAVWRYALPRAPVHVALGYTRVAALTYRNGEPALHYLARGIGIGRNFSDYDQWLARAELRPSPSLTLALDAHLLRQGSGDLRQPMPPDSVAAQPGQGFLVAPVSRAAGVRLAFDWAVREGVELRGELGTTGRVGASRTPIASLAASFGLDLLKRRAGGAYPAVERGANRTWP